MGAFKQFNSQDIIVSPLELNKGFSLKGGNALTASNIEIARYLGKNENFLKNRELTGNSSSLGDFREHQVTIYNSIKQLYYTNYISGSNGDVSPASTASFNLDQTVTGKVYSPLYDNYNQTDLSPHKYFPTGSGDTIGVLSVPKNLFGDYIQPKSLKIITESGSYIDDGEGRLKRLNQTQDNPQTFVGNVIYQHGIIVLTGGTRTEGIGETDLYGTIDYGEGIYGGRTINSNDILNFVTGSNITCSFSSSYGIFETQYKCTISENEYNYTYNPSIISSSFEGTLHDWATGSYFDPYVTTIGLYDNSENLLAVGKLAKPLPTSRTTDTTILINFDRQ